MVRNAGGCPNRPEAGADGIWGHDGADTLNGGDGDDLLMGGLGADVIVGGSGMDTVSWEEASERVVVNLLNPTGNGGEAAADRVSEVEAFILSAGHDLFFGDDEAHTVSGLTGNDTLEGGTANDRLSGDDGADHLDGGGGADILDGGAGADHLNGSRDRRADQLTGGEGDDRYIVDEAGEVIVEGETGGVDTVQTSVSYDLLRVANVENVFHVTTAGVSLGGNELGNGLTGNEGADTLSGRGGADTLRGGGGDDVLSGGADADLLDGGGGLNDTASYGDSTTGVTADLAGVETQTGDAQGDVFAGVENLYGGEFDDRLFRRRRG